PRCDTLIRNARVLDGSGTDPQTADVAVDAGIVCAIGQLSHYASEQIIEGNGHVLAPGFIDVHTHDDTTVIRNPQMMAKLSQGVTSVIVGNCGISAAPVRLTGAPPDPMNLLGEADAFRYPTFAAYAAAVDAAQPAVNVAALVGHTALRNNHMDRLDRAATADEVRAMRDQLTEALNHGALGLSTGLAYSSARSAPAEEILSLAEPLAAAGAIYASHMRTEAEEILSAMQEAFSTGRNSRVPVVISHLKCAGVANWGRSGEVLHALDTARAEQPVHCDCYPYTASSSTLDLRQVDGRVRIVITWSTPHPEVAGQTVEQIASAWGTTQLEAAARLQPAGAIYHNMSEEDVRRILQHPASMIGSDGLPNDPRPHPRLWGTFPRVLGYYCRDQGIFSLAQAVYKMTGMPAGRFGLAGRGRISEGAHADLVLFDPETIRDTATFSDPIRRAEGIDAVWVNGVLSYKDGDATGQRNGHFLSRTVSPS
ncbi:MAG TPA: D-aminoacylase, partial [Acidobacteriaceae bacterium]|nr:D-aminoacylase [Acidobacteriaceae bacterium]